MVYTVVCCIELRGCGHAHTGCHEGRPVIRKEQRSIHVLGGIKFMAKQERLRVRLKSYDHRLLDATVAKIIEQAERTGATIVGPIPLPTDKEVYTVIRSPHKYKKSREQFEIRTHKRLVDIINPTRETVDNLRRFDLPSGVDIEFRL